MFIFFRDLNDKTPQVFEQINEIGKKKNNPRTYWDFESKCWSSWRWQWKTKTPDATSTSRSLYLSHAWNIFRKNLKTKIFIVTYQGQSLILDTHFPSSPPLPQNKILILIFQALEICVRVCVPLSNYSKRLCLKNEKKKKTKINVF